MRKEIAEWEEFIRKAKKMKPEIVKKIAESFERNKGIWYNEDDIRQMAGLDNDELSKKALELALVEIVYGYGIIEGRKEYAGYYIKMPR